MPSEMRQKFFGMPSAMTEKFFGMTLAVREKFFGRGKGSFSARENVCLQPFCPQEKFFQKSLHFCFIRANILSRSPPQNETWASGLFLDQKEVMEHEKKSHFDSFRSALFLESHFCGWSRLRHGSKRLRSFSEHFSLPFIRMGVFLCALIKSCDLWYTY